VDLAPTLLEVGGRPPDPGHWRLSLVPALQPDADFESRPAPLELAIGRADPAQKRPPMVGLRTREFKVVREHPGAKPVVFDLATGQLAPLSVPREDPRIELTRAMWKAITTRGAALPRETGELPGDLEVELTNIGYLDGNE